MDYDRIIGLLDKYWKCETTLPEEEELRYFYKHCRQMPEELESGATYVSLMRQNLDALEHALNDELGA